MGWNNSFTSRPPVENMPMDPIPVKPYSVAEISDRLKATIATDPMLNSVYVIGEIIEIKINSGSGHAYFTIADKSAALVPGNKQVLRCVMWRGRVATLKVLPKIGNEVVLFGKITIYEPSSSYNFSVESLRYQGEGDLAKKIEEIRRKLREEGLTDPSRKKPLPLLPRTIGIISGQETAALRDIFKQIQDRYPHVDVIFAPARMQGEGSAVSVINAINEIIKPQYAIDVLIIARGGGSQEDLMAFNDMDLARRVADIPIPVVTGIGHEIDHPVVDDVADVAAATPTDAAKLVLPDVEELAANIQGKFIYLESRVKSTLQNLSGRLQLVSERPFFRDPQVLLEAKSIYLDDLNQMLRDGLRSVLDISWDSFRGIPDLEPQFQMYFQKVSSRMENISSRFLAYSPLATLKRGFSVVYHNGKILASSRNLHPDDEIRIQFHDGERNAKVLPDIFL